MKLSSIALRLIHAAWWIKVRLLRRRPDHRAAFERLGSLDGFRRED